MGAVRTTFAMVAAQIIRRKQLVERGFSDPFGMSSALVFSAFATNGIHSPALNGTGTPGTVSFYTYDVDMLPDFKPLQPATPPKVRYKHSRL